MALKKAGEMTVEELRAEVAKLEERREKRLVYSKARRAALTPEQREAQQKKRAEYARAYRERQMEVVERAKLLAAEPSENGKLRDGTQTAKLVPAPKRSGGPRKP